MHLNFLFVHGVNLLASVQSIDAPIDLSDAQTAVHLLTHLILYHLKRIIAAHQTTKYLLFVRTWIDFLHYFVNRGELFEKICCDIRFWHDVGLYWGNKLHFVSGFYIWCYTCSWTGVRQSLDSSSTSPDFIKSSLTSSSLFRILSIISLFYDSSSFEIFCRVVLEFLCISGLAKEKTLFCWGSSSSSPPDKLSEGVFVWPG